MSAATAVHPLPMLADLARKVQPTLQTGLMPGNGDKVGFWLSPKELMDPLNAEFGFTFDACPFPRPAGYDGLRDPWGKRGDTVWVNPPFVGPGSSRTAWARKAIAESRQGKDVVMINSVDRWLMLLAEAGCEFRAPPPFTWLDPNGKPRPKGLARPSILMILRGKDPAAGPCPRCGNVEGVPDGR